MPPRALPFVIPVVFGALLLGLGARWGAGGATDGAGGATDGAGGATDGGDDADPTLPSPFPSDKARGMTVSCPTWGWEWGSDAMVATLDELAALGVTWVAIHPYAGIAEDGSVRARPLDPTAPPAWLARPIAEAHRRGMRVLVKPHIAYWGTRWTWRGDIALPDPVQRARFFTEHGAFIVNLAAASAVAGADSFVVGTELDQLLDEGPWRQLIAQVRAVYSGPLTYAANWTDVERVPFWDALDSIGVQAYFPVLEGGESGAEGGVPSDAQLAAGWARVMKRLAAVSARTQRPVLFTELGYNRSARAAHEPWAYATGGARAEEVQVRCLAAALRAVEGEPSVSGVFLWKWFPGAYQPDDFRMASPAMRGVIAGRWGVRSAP